MSAGPARTRATRAQAAQLALELPLELPAIAIAPEWKAQQRLWGHSLHPMCSYLASFPAALTHAFIARYSRPGDVVLDPFSGRGTTPLQACAEGRIGVGNDLNPFAHLLTAAKVEPATRAAAVTRLTSLRLAWRCRRRRVARAWRRPSAPIPRTGGPEPVPAEVVVAFHPSDLRPAAVPARGRCDLDDRTDRFLAAAITGILHGKSASYLSELMPNTFSMAPRYVREFAGRTDVRLAASATCSTASRPSSTGCIRQPLPPVEGDRPARRRARRRAASPAALRAARSVRSGTARRDLAAVPAGRQVRLLQLAADVVPGLRRRGHRRHARRCPSPRAVPRLPARRAGRDCARSSPTTRSSCSSSATSRPTAGAASAAASGWRSGRSRRPPSRRAIASPASRSTTSRPSAR